VKRESLPIISCFFQAFLDGKRYFPLFLGGMGIIPLRAGEGNDSKSFNGSSRAQI
jgi:hypothetical protein